MDLDNAGMKALSNMDLDNAGMSLRDPGMTLKNEVTEQRRKMSNYEHECINGRMVADQLRRDKDMILDNEASIKAVMENFKEENTELSEVNYQLCLRVTEILQGKWDDVANSPSSQVAEELRKELSRLQQELRVKDGRIFEQSATVDKRTFE